MAHALEPDRELRTELTETVLAYLNDWYDAAEHMDGQGVELDAETLASFRAPPGETGRPLESILADLTLAGRDGHMHPSGGHMSYIPNSGMYTAALAEFLAAGLNRYTGVASAAPGFSAIEHGVVDWLRSIFDLGPESSGLLLSGGSMANFTGVVTARNAVLGDDFSDGVMYVTRHTHHSAAKAARLAGFRSDQVVTVDVDDPELGVVGGAAAVLRGEGHDLALVHGHGAHHEDRDHRAHRDEHDLHEAHPPRVPTNGYHGSGVMCQEAR